MIDAIITAIHEKYPNHRVYTENVQQGLKTPCFFVTQISANGNRHLQDRHKHTNQFMIQFFPQGKNVQAECSSMLRELTVLLATVGVYHANTLNGVITDGVLHYEVTYSEFIDVEPDRSVDEMGDYKFTYKLG